MTEEQRKITKEKKMSMKQGLDGTLKYCFSPVELHTWSWILPSLTCQNALCAHFWKNLPKNLVDSPNNIAPPRENQIDDR